MIIDAEFLEDKTSLVNMRERFAPAACLIPEGAGQQLRRFRTMVVDCGTKHQQAMQEVLDGINTLLFPNSASS